MKVLIAYDVNRRHDDVKSALLEAGFRDFWVTQGNVIHYLPDTTLWHPNLDGSAEAKRIFLKIINDLNVGQPPNNIITVSHFVAVEMGNISGVEGESHA